MPPTHLVGPQPFWATLKPEPSPQPSFSPVAVSSPLIVPTCLDEVPRVLEQWVCLVDSLLTDQPVVQLAQAVFSVLFADRSVHLIRRGSLAAIVEYDQLVIGASELVHKAQKV